MRPTVAINVSSRAPSFVTVKSLNYDLVQEDLLQLALIAFYLRQISAQLSLGRYPLFARRPLTTIFSKGRLRFVDVTWAMPSGKSFEGYETF
jgi:hypothetical protein